MKRLSTIVVPAILLLLLISTNGINAQSGAPTLQYNNGFCGHRLVTNHKGFPTKIQEQLEQQIYRDFQKGKLSKTNQVPDYVLPVVVHIIHNNGAENISDATVLQGISDLNAAYANIGYYDPTTGVDTKIQFCLAKRDPDGNATTGINRVQSPLTDMTLESDDIPVKNLIRWEPTEYVNIWLVREICSNAAGCGVAGYAYLPSSHGQPEDGIVMEASYFGSAPGASGVQIHEMGHYLGLYHTFEGGCTNDDCLADGDRVCDTPPDQSTASVPCSAAPNSCNTDADSGFSSDQPDLFQDYMDYGDFNCWSVFTQGQTERMGWFIENVRFSLLESQGCLDPCTSGLTASFSVAATTVNAGSTVNFTNTSVNATLANWRVDGLFFSSAINASYTFNTVGSFEICLTADNADPNCSDQFCQTFTVQCPANASFSANVFYPMPGQTVNYTNTSTSANTYQWKVNGVAQSTSTNFATSFPAVGVYEVCLTASNNLCSEEFCLSAFVTTALPPGQCDTSFLKIYGTPQDDEIGTSMVAVPAALGGGYLIGGGKGDSAMITRLDANANIIWTRAFDATPNEADFIWDLKFDSENRVFGSGQTKPEANGNIECFAFRYNMVTNTILWVNELDLNDPAQEIYLSVLEKSPGGNYIVAGQVTQVINGGTGCDGIILELNRNTGANVWQENYTLGSCETFQRTISYNNNLYATGRYNFDGGGTARMRPGITKMDMTGNQVWSKLYLRAVTNTTNARLYSSDIIADNGLVVIGQGDKNGTSDTNVNMFLFRTDADGELEWAMEYDIPGATSETSTRLYNLPDGYLCLGFYTAGNQDAFIFKTDKLGLLQWARSYGSNELEDARDLIVNNGVIYFTGKSNGLGNSGTSEDLFLASLTLDGSSTSSDSCNFFKDLDMTAITFFNPYEAQHDLTNLNQNWGNFLSTSGVGQTSVQSVTACIQTCIDSCDLVSDAVFQSATATCAPGKLFVTLNVCNDGNFPLPAGTPLTFYLSNPTLTNAAIAGTFTLPDDVKKDSCASFQFLVAASPNSTVYVMLNDEGTTPRPFTLATFEAEEMECNYVNNIGSFILNFTPPALNLGTNTTMCEFGVVELNAGANFIHYEWQDGSNEQFYTVFSPGTYSVTVTDACGGTQTDQINIVVDPETVLNLGPDLEICQGGSYTFNVSGFSSFVWTPATGLSCTNCPNPTLTPTTNGIYVLIATNAEGCIGVDSINVTVMPAMQATQNVQICQGQTVLIFGMPVSAAGQFTQTFSTAEGCDSISTVVVTVTPAIETSQNVAICEGESVVVFGMQVSAAGQFTQTFSTAEGCDSIHTVNVSVLPNVSTAESRSICQGQTSNIFGNPVGTAGVYAMTFTSANGCDSTHNITLTVKPVQTTSEAVTVCQGESILVFGNPVSTAGTFSQVFNGTNGCDSTHSITVSVLGNSATTTNIFICSGQTANIFGNPVSTAGSYSMTFAAANGCDSVSTIVLTVNPQISIGFSGSNVTCFGGSNGGVTASVSGGSGSFTYNWDSGGGTTASLSNLVAGTYTLTVTDSEFCAATASVNISQPAAVTPVATGINVSCTELGSVTCAATGGTGSYSFLWNNAATTAAISGLTAGTYAVTVTDVNGCTGTASATLTGGLGPQVSITVEVPLTAANPDGGVASAAITAGTAPIGIEWSNGETTATIENLSSGDYYVTVTDANACTASAVAHLYIPACTGGKIWNDYNRDGCQDPGEVGRANVQLTLNGTDIWGGTVPASTTTSSNVGEYLFENLPPGTYAVTVAGITDYSLSPPDECDDDSRDSDFLPATSVASNIVLVEGHCCLTVDCGVYESCLNVVDAGTLCCNQNLCGPGDPALITGTPATGSAGAVSYLWMYSHTPGAFDPGLWETVTVNGLPVTTQNFNPGILSQTTYFVRCVIGAGCAEWLESNIVSIVIGNTAVADILEPGPVCVNVPETLSAFANPAGATYAWSFGSWATPSTSTLQNATTSWNQPGYTNISLAVTYNGCTSTDAMTIAVSNNSEYCSSALLMPGNGINVPAEMATHFTPISADKRFSAYPNPVSELLTVEWSDAIETAVEVKIFSVEGRLLHLGQSGNGDLQYSLDLSGWTPGVYLLRLRHSEGEQTVLKLVKQ